MERRSHFKGETYTFDIANRDYTLFSSNGTYLLTTANIDDATLIAIPQGWTAVLNDKDLRIIQLRQFQVMMSKMVNLKYLSLRPKLSVK